MIVRSETASLLRGSVRAVSLAAAGGVSLVLLVYPYVLSGIPGWRVHAGLPIMMFGAAGLFMYGLGFKPRSRLIRGLFLPPLAWLLFAAGMLSMVGGG